MERYNGAQHDIMSDSPSTLRQKVHAPRFPQSIQNLLDPSTMTVPEMRKLVSIVVSLGIVF